MVAVLIGVISTLNDDSFVRLILGDGYVNMTIENIGEYNFAIKAYCSWFVEGEKKSDVFALEALVLFKN